MNYDLISEREAAELLAVAPGTLQAWRRVGHGPRYFKLGGKTIRYSRQDLATWIEGACCDAV